MREAGLTTPETLRPFHKGMWKQAKVKLGLAPPLSAAGKARKLRSRRYRQAAGRAASVAGRKMR